MGTPAGEGMENMTTLRDRLADLSSHPIAIMKPSCTSKTDGKQFDDMGNFYGSNIVAVEIIGGGELGGIVRRVFQELGFVYDSFKREKVSD